MSNDELLADKKFHDAINTYACCLGLSLSAAGAKVVIQVAWQNKKPLKVVGSL